jgi:HK97 family phage prohead protease
MKKTMENCFYIKNAQADEKRGVIIEGYANYNAVDRVKERMCPETVLLENFKNNPILLFNHDMDYPCGKVLELDPREEGLYVKARVSGVNESKVNYIRELVLDGVLKAFSIRYDVEDYEKSFQKDPLNKDCTLIKYWELQELSIVTIPCQQNSLFSIAGVKSLGELREMALTTKGANAAALINKGIDAVVAGGMEKTDVLEQISKVSGIELGEMAEILAGNVTPIPDQFISAVSQILELDSTELSEAQGEDAENQKSEEKGEEKEEKMESEEKMSDEEKMEEEEKGNCGKADEEEKGNYKEEEKSSDEEEEEKMPEDDEEKTKGMDNTVHENPMLERMDSMVALLGTLVNKFDIMLQSLEAKGDYEKLEYEEEKMEDDSDKMEMEKEEEKMEEDSDKMDDSDKMEEEEKYEEEDEEEMLRKGLDTIRDTLGDKCKKAGINIEEFLKM